MINKPLFILCWLMVLGVSISTSAQAQNSEPKADSVRSEQKSSDPSNDTLQLETSTITGNRELPKVLSIVPWKKSLPASVSGPPENSLLNDIIEPIDRDVFRRQLEFYQVFNESALKDSEPPVQ